MNEKRFDDFKNVYKKFIEGSQWLNIQMTKIDQDKEAFKKTVIEPMEKLWAAFTDEEKKYWNTVKATVNVFKAKLV